MTVALAEPTLLHRPADAGLAFWGPGDTYRFLVTGEETGGAYFAMEAIVPPGGGPPPHIHRNEDETFYVVEGSCDIRLGDTIVTFTPAGIEHFFEETLERAYDANQPVPDNIDEVAARYAAAAPRYGMEF